MIHFLKSKYSKVVSVIAFICSFLFSYTYLFIALPLNSDTTGAYNVGSKANLSHEWSIANGRWAKGILELIIEKLGYNNIVPFFLFIALLIACIYFIINLNLLFKFNNLIVSIFVSAVFFITPSFVSLFFYVNDLYAHIFAIILGGIIIKKCFSEQKWNTYVILLALMIGIYQSYICLICSIFIIYNIYLVINGCYKNSEEKNYIFQFIKFLGFTLLSVLLYAIVNLVCLKVFSVQSVLAGRFNFQYSFKSILLAIGKMYGMVLILPFKNYAGLNTTLLMKVLFTLSYVMILSCSIVLVTKISLKRYLYVILLIVLLPAAMNCITLASTHIIIQMTFGLGTIYLLIAIFADYMLKNIEFKQIKEFKSNLLVIMLSIIIVHMIYFANGYTYLSKIVSDSTKTFVIELVSNIKNKVGYTPNNKILFYGEINDNNLTDYYAYYDNDLFPIASPYNTLLYPWEYKETINRYGAYKYQEPSKEEIDKIIYTEQFKDMTLYPNEGSIMIINNIIVVKFSN